MGYKSLVMDVPIDRGWAWVIMTCAFLLTLLVNGSCKAYGVIHAELMIDDEESSTRVVAVQSLALALQMGFGPLAIAVYRHEGARITTWIGSLLVVTGYVTSGYIVKNWPDLMYLTYGIIVGMGRSFVFATCNAIISQYFSKRISLAMGCGQSGACLGSLLWPYAFRFLFDSYGIKHGMALCGTVALNGIALAGLLRPVSWFTKYETTDVESMCEDDGIIGYGAIEIANRNSATDIKTERKTVGLERKLTENYDEIDDKQESDTSEDGAESKKDEHESASNKVEGGIATIKSKIVSIWKNYTNDYSLGLLILSFNLSFSAGISNLVLVPAHGVEIGLTKHEIAGVMTCFGAADFVGRIVVGIIADLSFVRNNRKMMYFIMSITFGVAGILSPLTSGVTSLSLYAVCVGTFGFSWHTVMMVILVDDYGKERFAPVYAYTAACSSPSSPLTVFLFGYIQQMAGSWAWPLRVTGILSLMSSFAMIAQMMIMERRKKQVIV